MEGAGCLPSAKPVGSSRRLGNQSEWPPIGSPALNASWERRRWRWQFCRQKVSQDRVIRIHVTHHSVIAMGLILNRGRLLDSSVIFQRSWLLCQDAVQQISVVARPASMIDPGEAVLLPQALSLQQAEKILLSDSIDPGLPNLGLANLVIVTGLCQALPFPPSIFSQPDQSKMRAGVVQGQRLHQDVSYRSWLTISLLDAFSEHPNPRTTRTSPCPPCVLSTLFTAPLHDERNVLS